ncbi:MAG: hypothetical protein ACU836_17540 [Gammaproteobacteria bacterium]
MEAYVPLFQTLLWILLITSLFIYFRSEIKKRLEQGGSFKIGPVELGEIKHEISTVRRDIKDMNIKVSDLFLSTMAPSMYKNLEKISTGHFGKYIKSKGLERELYHLRDIGYIEVESIKGIPDQGDDLSIYVSITETGKKFVTLRNNIENEKLKNFSS